MKRPAVISDKKRNAVVPMNLMHRKLHPGDHAPNFDFQSPWSQPQNFYDSVGNFPAAMVFLRYQGCPVCRMEMARLKRESELFTRSGARLLVCLQSTPESVASSSVAQDWPFTIICDPQGAIFRKFGVAPGGLLKYLHPAGAVAAIKAIGGGFRHGRFEGKETQLPAAFAISADKTVIYAYYGSHIADVPAPSILSTALNSEHP